MKRLFEDSPLVQSYPTTSDNALLWRPDLGFGYLKSNGFSYGDGYWENYQNLKVTPIGERLNQFRISFVKGNLPAHSTVCDVGIGSGHFVEKFPCLGFDVNPQAVEWLKAKAYWGDPYVEEFATLTFWDVLEHIDEPAPLLTAPNIFMSLPIHQSAQACLASKHLKPNEHIWYFTEGGLKTFMACYGYQLIAQSDGETRIGREDIMSYYFHK